MRVRQAGLLHDRRGGAACALPAPLPAACGPALPRIAPGDQLVGPDRLPRAAARLLAPAALPLRKRGESDAARGIPPPDRQPDADPHRARAARPDDHGLGQRPGHGRLPPGRGPGAAPARGARPHADVHGRLLRGLRVLQRRRPGAPLLRLRPARPASLAPLCAASALLDRRLAALGLLALLARPRLQDVLQGRLARHRSRPARARGRPFRARTAAPLNGGADRKPPPARGGPPPSSRRCGAYLRTRSCDCGTNARSPPRRIGERAPLRPRHPHGPRLPHGQQHHGAPTARLLSRVGVDAGTGRQRPRTRAALPAPPRPRPPDPRRLPPGARHPRARGLGRADGTRRPGGHVHRPPQQPQPRQRRGPDAGAPERRPAAANGPLRRPGPGRPHARRARPRAAQPPDPEGRDGALRLHELLARVVALRPPGSRDALFGPDAGVRVGASASLAGANFGRWCLSVGGRQQGATVEQVLGRLGNSAHGLVRRAQLLRLGVTPSEIRHRLCTGALLVEYPGVYRVGHRAPSLEARYLAAVLACGEGALLSGRAAGYLFGALKGLAPPPEVTAPTKRRVRGVKTRRSRAVEATTYRGIPVTTLARTLVDLAAVLDPDDLARAFHEAEVRHGTTPAHVEAVLARRPNSPGAAKLRAG